MTPPIDVGKLAREAATLEKTMEDLRKRWPVAYAVITPAFDSLRADHRRELSEAARELEKRGQAIADAMGRERGTEPLIKAVKRLADDVWSLRADLAEKTAEVERQRHREFEDVDIRCVMVERNLAWAKLTAAEQENRKLREALREARPFVRHFPGALKMAKRQADVLVLVDAALTPPAPPVAETPPRISLGKDWPATKDRLVREIRESEKLTGADMAQRIGVAETPREPEKPRLIVVDTSRSTRDIMASLLAGARERHTIVIDPPAPLTRAEEAQCSEVEDHPWRGRCALPDGHEGFHRFDYGGSRPEPPPEAQSEEPLPLGHEFEKCGIDGCFVESLSDHRRCHYRTGGKACGKHLYAHRAAHAPGATGEGKP